MNLLFPGCTLEEKLGVMELNRMRLELVNDGLDENQMKNILGLLPSFKTKINSVQAYLLHDLRILGVDSKDQKLALHHTEETLEIASKVGAADVVGAIMENNAIFGFEENGGSIFPKINLGREGGLTAVKILKILHDKKKKLSEIIAEYPKFYQIKEKIQCRDELKNKLTLAIKEKIKESKESKYKNTKIDETDGIKILFSDGWILFRPSWTEPIYRIFAEGKSESRTAELIEFGRKIANESLKGLIC